MPKSCSKKKNKVTGMMPYTDHEIDFTDLHAVCPDVLLIVVQSMALSTAPIMKLPTSNPTTVLMKPKISNCGNMVVSTYPVQ